MAQRNSLLVAPFMPPGVVVRMMLTPVCAPGRQLCVTLPVASCPPRPAQRLHEIDHPVRRRQNWSGLQYRPGLPGLEVGKQRLLIAVPEGRGIKGTGLAVKDVLGQ